MKIKILALLVGAALVLALVWKFWGSKNASATHGQVAYAHTETILSFGPRPPESEGLAKSQAYISQELAKHGWRTMVQTFERSTPVGKKKFTNLIARYHPKEINSLKELTDLPTSGILCAHLDSKPIPEIPDFLGADDAASACALIIELAKTLATEHPDLAKKLELVFFDGEESFAKNMTPSDGLYGSHAYAITLYKRHDKPRFGILLDMVGHKNLRIAIPPDSPNFLKDALMRSAKNHGVEDQFTTSKSGIIDDHYYMNKAGVPTIDVIGADFASTDWWHQHGDTLDIISAESLQTSHQVIYTMLQGLLED